MKRKILKLLTLTGILSVLMISFAFAGWEQVGSNWRYKDDGWFGDYVKSGKKVINNVTYFFKDGWMLSNTDYTDGGVLYKINSSGAAYKYNGWQKKNGEYYLYNDGRIKGNIWTNYNGDSISAAWSSTYCYRTDSSGAMLYGEKQLLQKRIDGVEYTIDTNGVVSKTVIKNGWVDDILYLNNVIQKEVWTNAEGTKTNKDYKFGTYEYFADFNGNKVKNKNSYVTKAGGKAYYFDNLGRAQEASKAVKTDEYTKEQQEFIKKGIKGKSDLSKLYVADCIISPVNHYYYAEGKTENEAKQALQKAIENGESGKKVTTMKKITSLSWPGSERNGEVIETSYEISMILSNNKKSTEDSNKNNDSKDNQNNNKKDSVDLNTKPDNGFPKNPTMGWNELGNGDWGFYWPSGEFPNKNGWLISHWDNNVNNGKWYYLNSKGVMLRNCYVYPADVNGHTLTLDESKAVKASNGKAIKYYFKNDGEWTVTNVIAGGVNLDDMPPAQVLSFLTKQEKKDIKNKKDEDVENEIAIPIEIYTKDQFYNGKFSTGQISENEYLTNGYYIYNKGSGKYTLYKTNDTIGKTSKAIKSNTTLAKITDYLDDNDIEKSAEIKAKEGSSSSKDKSSSKTSKKITVTIKSGYKTKDKQSVAVDYEGSYTLPTFEEMGWAEKPKYTFSHWAIGSKKYNPGDTIDNIKSKKTITAKWKKD